MCCASHQFRDSGNCEVCGISYTEVNEGRKTYIDITPPWSDLVRPMLMVYRDTTNPESLVNIATEFKKMAALADRYVELQKQGLV
jgi:hypothetical protein